MPHDAPDGEELHVSVRRFDAVSLDFYGTISAGDRDAVEATCCCIVEACDLPVIPQELAIRWGEQFFDLIERSNHDAFQTLYECELGSLRTTLAGFGINRDPAPFVAKLEEYWANPPIYADAIGFLNGVDLPVCCVSNADTKPLLAAIEKHDLRFDAVITSEVARCYKPDPGIFRRAVEVVGVRPERMLHIGDSLHSDVGGAARLGIATAWLRRENRIHDIGNCQPEYTLATLAELSRLLSG
ncbi:MAG: HAD family hydrolase [Phycisphaerae bacterium]